MPIWLRQFTFKKIQSHYAEEAAAIKSARSKTSKGTSVTKDGKVTSPEFLSKAKLPPKSKPTYTTKMSKK